MTRELLRGAPTPVKTELLIHPDCAQRADGDLVIFVSLTELEERSEPGIEGRQYHTYLLVQLAKDVGAVQGDENVTNDARHLSGTARVRQVRIMQRRS